LKFVNNNPFLKVVLWLKKDRCHILSAGITVSEGVKYFVCGAN